MLLVCHFVVANDIVWNNSDRRVIDFSHVCDKHKGMENVRQIEREEQMCAIMFFMPSPLVSGTGRVSEGRLRRMDAEFNSGSVEFSVRAFVTYF